MERKEHIYINQNPKSFEFTPVGSGRDKSSRPQRNRTFHGERLLRELENAISTTEEDSGYVRTVNGKYITFSSLEGYDLITKSLEDIGHGVRLCNVQEVSTRNGSGKIVATVYIPNGQEKILINKIQKYKNEDTAEHKPKNAKLVESIESIERSLLESLWTDNPLLFPGDARKWCEVWLMTDPDYDVAFRQVQEFEEMIISQGIDNLKRGTVFFPERAVKVLYANKDDLLKLMYNSGFLAEIRNAQELSGFWGEQTYIEQMDWVLDLASRLQIPEGDMPLVCLLDGGVTNGHPLLKPAIPNGNLLTVDNDWGTVDKDRNGHYGHGTSMSGVILYGELTKSLESTSIIELRHQISSVKILPTRGENIVDHWGFITEQAIYINESALPNRRTLYCMPVSVMQGSQGGRPSAWSGSIDKLCYNQGNGRLIFLAGGNTDIKNRNPSEYPNICSNSSIENPGQSWNAIVVGGFTNLAVPIRDGISYPLARKGEISPYSTTSKEWDSAKWPIKPDIVFEAGNLLNIPRQAFPDFDPNLEILTTSRDYMTNKPFTYFNGTSLASAMASWFGAKLMDKFRTYRPETIRALIVHSAEWTDEMLAQYGINLSRCSKSDIENLMRHVGYGTPQLEKALYSFENSTNLIVENVLQPYKKNPSSVNLNDMHFFELPWPKEQLRDLGPLPVKLKITLSYFIEPGPGEVGWKDRYKYASCGLRFELNNQMTEEEFIKKINKKVREADDEITEADLGSDRWVIGKNNRKFSIQSDFWNGTAADLAECNLLAIYPVAGWWKDRPHLKRYSSKINYSLIVSLETPDESVQFHTEILSKIPVAIEVPTRI